MKRNLILWMCSLALGQGQAGAEETSLLKNRYVPWPAVANRTEGTTWPKGQALPTFATPAAGLDTLVIQALSPDEQITFSALQGLVNRKQPRILLLEARAEEGRETWAHTATVNLSLGRAYDRDTKYELLAKYAAEVAGVVLYDPGKNPHYRNLAGTAASLRRALPVTPDVLARLREKGIPLEVVEDLTTAAFTTPLEIYQHLYERYWPQCEKRLLVSAKPLDERGRGDYHHTRDMAAATGAAVVWLNTQDPAERDMLRKFLGGMKAGEAIILGWYTTERSGIPTASEFGIGTMPADHFISSTVYAGSDHHIRIPAVPPCPSLEKKAYVAVFISDGDNIQYTQHAMRRNWDRTAGTRGRMPLNWTVAPGLVDIAPGILNYYYTTATSNDCFVTGPSGMGYLMPFNTLEEPGAPVGDKLTDPARMEGYARLTETYLQRSGLRILTIWDDATPMQRQAYETHCRSLYGATVQNFRDVRSVAGSVVNQRIRFDKLVVPYTGSSDHLQSSLTRRLQDWNGQTPLFLAYQVDIWGELKPDRLVEFQEKFSREYSGKIQFVRADHYFHLYNEANGIPFPLTISSQTIVSDAAGSPGVAAVRDGTPASLWTAPDPARPWVEFDFGQDCRLNRCLIRHAGAAGLGPDLNSTACRLEALTPDGTWKTVHEFQGNRENVTDFEFPPATVRKVRLVIGNPGSDGVARIAEVELYGIR